MAAGGGRGTAGSPKGSRGGRGTAGDGRSAAGSTPAAGPAGGKDGRGAAAPLVGIVGGSRSDFPVLEGAADFMRRIQADFVYDTKATQVATPLDQAFTRKSGVCQDFAHIMIAGLRGLGLPAAYVSGYLRTIPAPGQTRLEGADSTHAWVSLWCGPEFGWLDLDPTNAMMVEDDHIVIAIGRDYADVSPVDGVLLGAGKQKLDVSVDVQAVSA